MTAGALTTFPDWLAYRAGASASRVALVAGGHSWTYRELDDECSRLARRLATLGVQPNDRVASLLHNGFTAALLPHALLRLGATLVPMNVRLHHLEVGRMLAHASPRLVLLESATAGLLSSRGATPVSTPPQSPVAGEARFCTFVSADEGGATAAGCAWLGGIAEGDVALRLAHPASDVLAVVYTSGTTGRSRGAMLTVGNFWWSAVGSALNLGVHEEDRWLACLPLFHVGGLSIVLRSAIYGTAAEVHERFDAASVNRAIDDGVTIVSLVSVMLQRLLEDRGDRPFPSTLRCLLVGGGPVPTALLERCTRARAPVAQTYGLTECASQVATLAPQEAHARVGSAGRVLYPNEIRIARPADAADDAGEILVRGPVVMAGYLGDPEASAQAMTGGWLHTGDIGRLDQDGCLYVLDRRDDLIVSGGENVYPAEVEAALLEHPWVEEAAVVGAADETWGQRVVALVRLRPAHAAAAPTAPEALRAHCRARLAAYKSPAEIRIVTESLPRTASGKLQRAALR